MPHPHILNFEFIIQEEIKYVEKILHFWFKVLADSEYSCWKLQKYLAHVNGENISYYMRYDQIMSQWTVVKA